MTKKAAMQLADDLCKRACRREIKLGTFLVCRVVRYDGRKSFGVTREEYIDQLKSRLAADIVPLIAYQTKITIIPKDKSRGSKAE